MTIWDKGLTNNSGKTQTFNLGVTIGGEAFSHVEWIEFNYNDPIGVHLNEFALYTTHEGNYIMLYTKILHTSGKVGYLALSVCSDLCHNMELV